MNKVVYLILAILLVLPLVSADYGIGNSNSYGIGAKEVSGTTNINNSYTNINNTYINGSSYNASYVPYTGGIADLDLTGYALISAFLQGLVGSLDMRGDPWYLGGTNLEIAEIANRMLQVGGPGLLFENVANLGNVDYVICKKTTISYLYKVS